MTYRDYPQVPAFDRYVEEIGFDALIETYCDTAMKPLPDAPEDLKRDLEKLAALRRS